MKKTVKLSKAETLYGIVIDELSLISAVSGDVEFAKRLLRDDEYSIFDYVAETFKNRIKMNDWQRIEITKDSYAYVIGRSISLMKDEETMGEFKEKAKKFIKTLIKSDFSCKFISIPDGEYDED